MTPAGLLPRLLLLAGSLALAGPARGADVLSDLNIPEKPAGWVTDLTGSLDPAVRSELADLSARYQKGSGHDVAVLLVPSLQGKPIEQVGLEVFRTWKLGREGVNDGALLLIATQDHELRIEVGRGLEGDLTDLISSRIIRNVIVPQFKAGDLAGGVRDGITAIHAAAGGNYADIPDDQRVDQTLPPLLALAIILGIVIVIVILKSRHGGRGGRGRGGPFVMPFPFPINIGGSGGGGGGFGGFGGGGGGGFGGFGGGGGAIGGGASGRW